MMIYKRGSKRKCMLLSSGCDYERSYVLCLLTSILWNKHELLLLFKKKKKALAEFYHLVIQEQDSRLEMNLKAQISEK